MNFVWQGATLNDVSDMVAMAETHFQQEIDQIYKPEPHAYSRNLSLAIVNQFYQPNTHMIGICRNDQGKLQAYTWAQNNHRAPWSDDIMITITMAHVALDLSARTRIALVNDMMQTWENFARFCRTPIICSTTMRSDQQAFLRLHERNGYDVRGSYAYKRINFEAQ